MTATMPWTTWYFTNKRYGECGCYVRFKIDKHWMDFELIQPGGHYQTAALPNGGTSTEYGSGRLYFQKREASRSPEPTENIEEAERLAYGFIKWDGCHQWRSDHESYHVDGRSQIREWAACLELPRRIACREMDGYTDAEEEIWGDDFEVVT